jgi:hypothetical protein
MKRFLLDTNHIGEAIGRVSIVRDRVQQMHRQGAVFGTCGPVLARWRQFLLSATMFTRSRCAEGTG